MNQQPEALRLAEHLDDRGLIEEAAELRRLQAEIDSLKAELQEQARVNGMGGERELKLMAENEALRKDAERWQMTVIVQNESLTHPNHRKNPGAFKAYMGASHRGDSFEASIDAAILALANQQEKQQ